jgi:predicted lipoprotein with Yx(FWY)xxD motif
VHSQSEGKPGPILGYSLLNDGANSDVAVEIDVENATEILYAMLHSDAGEIGTFEFPDGPDVPVQVDGKMVTPAFAVTDGTMPSAVIMLGGNDELGEFLTSANGMTLYTYSKDEVGVTNCYDQCAVNWPPLYLEEGQDLAAGEGKSGELDAIERSDGGMQVTYNGLPLYFWIQDTEPGQTTGHGVNEVWAVARAVNSPIQLANYEEFGNFLIGPDGMTLYIFTKDQPGVSNCYNQCAVNWPPLMLW